MITVSKFSLLALASALACSLMTPTAFAGGTKKGPNDGPKPAVAAASPAVQAADALNTAYALVRYGDAKKDAIAMITAARIIKEVGTRDSKATREGAAAPVGSKAGSDKYALDNVLARARALSEGRQDLIALIDDVAKGGTRGSVRGVERWTDVVLRGATDRYRITFNGGEEAAVAISGDGDSDLDLYVKDENGNIVCKDDDPTDDMICRWHPSWTGSFIIEIVNRGMANRYVGIHN